VCIEGLINAASNAVVAGAAASTALTARSADCPSVRSAAVTVPAAEVVAASALMMTSLPSNLN